ncbi:MAG TPA: hypothetical protein VFX35_03065 [Solirubrobacterales bacterium]|nr:hypothetical protein [Solirubrobacterales bacterium]
MITVVETWYLAPEAARNAAKVMKEIDDIVGPIAHAHPGWCGHARFLQALNDPMRVSILYPWRSIEDHEHLTAQEEPHLERIFEEHCTQRRSFQYYTELPHP